MSDPERKLYRCRDNHPTLIKFEKLCAYAQELGISLHHTGHEMQLQDESDDTRFSIVDLEDDGRTFSDAVRDFPPVLEVKILYRK